MDCYIVFCTLNTVLVSSPENAISSEFLCGQNLNLVVDYNRVCIPESVSMVMSIEEDTPSVMYKEGVDGE